MSDIPVLKYFDLSPFGPIGGRGAALRFFLLQNGVQFREETVGYNDWAKGLKQEAINTKENISGHLPMLRINGENLIESFAIMRMLSKQKGLYGVDAKCDYLVDAAADLGAEWRIAFLEAAFGNDQAKEQYQTSPLKRSHYYKLFNTIITRGKGSGPHLIGDLQSFADCVVFAVLWDDIVSFGESRELLGANPQLAEFFKAYSQQDAVKRWCKEKKPDLVA
eukprot:GHRR01002071.1.p1 GENE.GHRR01002071.1~~GHRR01002071.1.p1  ORF type:complete len:221 (+),score=58.70 GHRR01002071.1:94-756(+)